VTGAVFGRDVPWLARCLGEMCRGRHAVRRPFGKHFTKVLGEVQPLIEFVDLVQRFVVPLSQPLVCPSPLGSVSGL
jgi:hypothetical protein